MNAILSGVSETAYFLDNGKIFSIHLAKPSTKVERSNTELNHFLRNNGRLVYRSDVSQDVAVTLLNILCNQEDALDLSLMILDGDLSLQLRRKIAIELDNLFLNGDLIEYIENIFFSMPMPSKTLLGESNKVCLWQKCTRVSGLFHKIFHYQNEINIVWQSWESIPMSLFKDESERHQIRYTLIEQGLFKIISEEITRTEVDVLENKIKQLHGQWLNFEKTLTVFIKNVKTYIRREKNITIRKEDLHFWMGVVDRAVRDLMALEKYIKSDPYLLEDPVFRYDYQTFKKWFRSSSCEAGSFKWICSLHGLDPDWALNKINEQIKYQQSLVEEKHDLEEEFNSAMHMPQNKSLIA